MQEHQTKTQEEGTGQTEWHVDVASGSPQPQVKEQNQKRPVQKQPEDLAKDTSRQDAAESLEDQEDGFDAQKTTAQELEAARKEIEQLRDSWSRERAEFMNFRKRVIQERQKQIEDTVVGFVQELLPAFDNLDQVLSLSLETKSEETRKYVDGVAMIRESFMQVLKNKNIKLLHPVNEEFDPQVMEAIAFEERDDLTRDIVLEVYQSGYSMETGEGQRQLVRPARVRVGKPAASYKQSSNTVEDGNKEPKI